MIAWIDASGGIAGDMLLGALLDAGADLAVVQRAVDAVLPGSALLRVREVTRAGTRAAKLDVEVLVDDPPHRHWSDIRARITAAKLAEPVRATVLAAFGRLAEAEGRVHGVSPEDIHFHEVGAVDSIADIVGVSAAVHDLGVTSVTGSPAAVGSGRMRIAHGDMAIPGPAVTELLRDWPIHAGGAGELTTPTGAALLTTLAARPGGLPPMMLHHSGTGAGSRDDPNRANVTRVLLGDPAWSVIGPGSDPDVSAGGQDAVLLETNVDDLDPRIWPAVLTAVFDAGAADAWLVPIVMKKGRPAHVLSVLCDPDRADRLRAVMLAHTTSFGVRQTPARKFPAARGWIEVAVGDATIPVKIAHADGRILRATPEFDDVAALAAHRGEPVLTTMDAARAAAIDAGLLAGEPLPTGLHTTRPDPAKGKPS